MEAHIEDPAEAYELDGMPFEEAVAEMGDPVLVGGELDHIHRPSTPFNADMTEVYPVVYEIFAWEELTQPFYLTSTPHFGYFKFFSLSVVRY